MNRYLTADIGGTSSRYAIFESKAEGALQKKESTWLKTADFASFRDELDQLVKSKFVDDISSFDAFVVAGAGPTKGDSFIGLTQVPWAVDLENLPDSYKAKKNSAINDFAALAYACLSPIRAETEKILTGQSDPNGPIVVVGAGTGLGIAALIKESDGYFRAISSEGGHVNFAPESDEDYAFLKFVAEELSLPYPSFEDTLSGRGLKLSHQFATGENLTPEEVSKRLQNAPKTVELFAKNYGRFCRNTALQYIATGGVYIAGGIAARNQELIKHPAFEQSFRGTRQHKELLSGIEVRLLDNQESGLLGGSLLWDTTPSKTPIT